MLHGVGHVDAVDGRVVPVHQNVADAQLVLDLAQEVELRVEAHGPLVQELDVVRLLLGREAVHEALVDLRGAAEHVQVLGDLLQNLRPLDLDGDVGAVLGERRLVDLG